MKTKLVISLQDDVRNVYYYRRLVLHLTSCSNKSLQVVLKA